MPDLYPFDYAIIRVVPSDYERGYEILEMAKLPFTESDLLVVKLPDNDQPLLTITKALLAGEVNNHVGPGDHRRQRRWITEIRFDRTHVVDARHVVR